MRPSRPTASRTSHSAFPTCIARSSSTRPCSGWSRSIGDENFLQAQTPGARDALVFERSEAAGRSAGGIGHLGFRLTHPATIDHAAKLVTHAGGMVQEQGEFVPGEPYLFARDRDGYLFEIWYELPTVIDPPESAT